MPGTVHVVSDGVSKTVKGGVALLQMCMEAAPEVSTT